MNRFYTVVVGAGSGGLTVAIGLAKFGKRVALVERKHVGGDCTNVGCIPSKTLIHLTRGEGSSPEAILQRVRDKRDGLRLEETEWVRNIGGLTFYEGEARVLERGRLEVRLSNGERTRLEAKNIVLATGSRPRSLTIGGLPKARTLTNESLFDLTRPPEHLAMIGGGIIASEMAFAFRRLGSRVSIVQRGERILNAYEPEVSETVLEAMMEAGVEVRLGATPSHYDEEEGTLHLNGGGALFGVDRVLLAVGRVPNVEGLGLERVGVVSLERGIPVNHYGKTNVKGIYAVGDVTTTSAFTHSANAQGRRLVQRLAFPFLPVPGDAPAYPSAVFTDPEVATVGPSLRELRREIHPSLIKTVRVELKETDRAYTQGLERGFVLLHARRLTGRLLSATVVAPHASEMVSLLTLALEKGVTLYSLTSLVFPYPTLSEAIKKAADEFLFDTLPNLPRELLAYARYRWRGPMRKTSTVRPTLDRARRAR